ncbi:diacylglycerol kinase [Paragemmobacter straminiformis]|uniref:Diacylglycerol kinase n=1 Tax=Paragemmobacter straminiformis TaxID=2045119 RepID=A0A842ICN9_9RHOB|nr:diacylglycerol kinase [Gemmobacter straminiformis]MBC2836728.1 diacylglycerol kinase [Gemmobacter straminiformis]
MLEWLWAEVRRVRNTAVWSWQGWQSAWSQEKSLRQWTLANALSAAAAFALDLGGAERAVIIGFGLLVLVAELVNTAIEEVVDYISTDIHPRAKRAKDCGSAAVAVTALAAGAAWVVVLIG